MKSKLILLILLFSISINHSFAKEVYKIDTKSSIIKWYASKVVGSHNGTVMFKDGELHLDGDKIIAGTFNTDMTTIKDLDLESEEWNKKLVDHLKSDDFFSVAKHKTANLKITKIVPKFTRSSEEPNYTITANFTIKSITHQISFPARIDFKGNAIHANGKFLFDRTKWKIEYNSGSILEGLGDKMIYDDVELEFDIVFKK